MILSYHIHMPYLTTAHPMLRPQAPRLRLSVRALHHRVSLPVSVLSILATCLTVSNWHARCTSISESTAGCQKLETL
eukprot:1489830-Rhodomonas_salina.1